LVNHEGVQLKKCPTVGPYLDWHDVGSG